jgi:hypothetical protein
MKNFVTLKVETPNGSYNLGLWASGRESEARRFAAIMLPVWAVWSIEQC